MEHFNPCRKEQNRITMADRNTFDYIIYRKIFGITPKRKGNHIITLKIAIITLNTTS